MEKRILIALALSFAVLFAFQLFNPPVPPAPVPETPASLEPDSTPSIPAPEAAPAPAPAPAPTDIQEEKARDVSVSTPLLTASVANMGGALKSLRLTEYTDAEGRPLELINGNIATKVGWPLAIISGDAAVDKILADGLYRMEPQGMYGLKMELAAQGIHASKEISFDPDKYVATITTSLSRNGTPVPHSVAWQGGFGDQSIQPPDPTQLSVVYGDAAAGYTRIGLPDIEEPQEVSAPVAGVEDRYFLAAFVADQSRPARVSKSEFSLPDGTAASALYLGIPSSGLLTMYIGPKHEASLAAADARLTDVPNYGFFSFITKPLLLALRGIHHFVGNYGWAIVILTVVINIVMFPLRVKQQVSMQKMQKMAPQIRALQEKYKKLKAGDPKRSEVEAELMRVNKEQMSGCLPSLLQMPLLLAFWSMLSVSIELRNAPWILWIRDLSVHDPYYVIPILMGVSMFIAQKMMPTTMDPAQAKIMMIMPLIFLGFFLWAQSGVALYWLTSNVVGIAQTWFIKEYWSGEEAKVPAAQRKPQGG
jgi:YidC/Oxa1 family membrane protein insertase